MKGNIAKAIILLIIISVLELLVLVIATVLQTASDLKFKMTSDILYNQIIETVLSPISTAMNFIDDKNPIVIILGIAVPIYVLYTFLKPSKKKNAPWEVDEEHGYHGTARFAKHNEIAKDKNFKLQSQKEILAEFEQSLLKEVKK
ncbi:hypothetical protein [Staphylococcus aureus]|uniref:hypothetical protein n=1 Tax=Staphylococcus aureus TaxID=1280 RepID=UPI000DE1AFDB|nr:hypothetical protein [Staphylococcus aureus]